MLHHHERYDGTGYPAAQRGDDITLESRIIAVADAFEAMTGERPYHSSLSPEQALEELQRHSGSQFDGRCVDALVQAVAEDAVVLRRSLSPASAPAAG